MNKAAENMKTKENHKKRSLKSVINKAEDNYKKKRTSPAFKIGEEAIKWLEKQGI